MGNKGKKKSHRDRIFLSKKMKSIMKNFLFSRIILFALILLFQLALYLFFILWLSSYAHVLLGSNVLIVFIFMIILANSNGKNEFKIAWLVPVSIFPIFGVAMYLLYHTNGGGKRTKKRLLYLKEKTESYLPDKSIYSEKIEENAEIKGITNFLMNSDNFYPSYDSNVTYFKNGELFFEDFMAQLEKAKKFIFIEFFIIDLDESWEKIVSVLERRVADGVEVRVLYDAIGSVTASSKFYVDYLKSKGIDAQIFLPLFPVFSTQQNNRDHRKIVIIDGHVGYTGGVNISNEYFNMEKRRFNYWKDNAIRIEGSAIRSFVIMFLQTWNISKKRDDNFKRYIESCDSANVAKNEGGVIIPYGDDAYNNQDLAENIYLYILDNAKKYVYITTPYVLIDNQLSETLIFAAHRGVEVSIIVPSVPDHFVTFCIGRVFIKKLIDNGVKVYEYKKGFIHAKTFVSDDKIATIGSVNLDYRSLYHHFECGALLYNKPCIKDIKNDFEEMIQNDCKEFTQKSYKKFPWFNRMIGRILKVFAPLM